MKQLFILSFILVSSSKIYSQISVGYFPFQSVMSISSDPEKLVWADLGIETNTFISNINIEGSAFINLKRAKAFNIYSGIGINTNPFFKSEGLALTNGYAFKTGARIKPFEEYRNVQFIFELSPYLNKYLDGGIFRTRLGVSYIFGKNNHNIK